MARYSGKHLNLATTGTGDHRFSDAGIEPLGKSRSGATKTDAQGGLLTKAALSHLQLALLNLNEHVYALQDEDHAELCRAEARLRQLTNSNDTSVPPQISPLSASEANSNSMHASVLPPTSPVSTSPCTSVPCAVGDDSPERRHSGPPPPSNNPPMLEVASGIVPSSPSQRTITTVVFSEPWQQQLMDMFDEIDTDNSGSIRGADFRKALIALSITPAKSKKLLQAMDSDGNGSVSRDEWQDMVVAIATKRAPTQVSDFTNELLKLKGRNGRLYPKVQVKRERFMLIYDSNHRLAWDLLIIFLLCYIAAILPLTLGFKRFMTERLVDGFEIVETIIDCLFLLDVVLNFRTTIVDRDGNHIVNGRRVARQYLKTWFVLDFISSVPQDLIFDSLVNLQVFKLLKVGKATKALKLLRLGRVVKRIENNDIFEEVLLKGRWAIKLASLSTTALAMCHWLACLMVAMGSDCLEEYQDVASSFEKMYLAAIYWAMTTMTTVGYGDIIPSSDLERACAILAMILGGGFYGYVIGSIAGVISTSNANQRAYHERLDLIQAWIDHHSELPVIVARRIRRHFKKLLVEKTALEDAVVLKDLTPELRIELAHYVIDDEVRHNMLFDSLPNTALAKLVPIIHRCHAEVNDKLATTDEPGAAMFIVLEGTAHMQWNLQNHPHSRKLDAGESFGEEIVLQLDQYYRYTVIATSQMALHMIQAISFQECFASMPDQLLLMRENFMRLRKPETSNSETVSENMKHFRAMWKSRSFKARSS